MTPALNYRVTNCYIYKLALANLCVTLITHQRNGVNNMSPEYTTALEVSNQASRKFRVASEAYRARQIGDAEFLSAKAEHDQALVTFDVAYAKETA